MQSIERFDLHVDLSSNNLNLPVAALVENEELIPYGFSQLRLPDMGVEITDTSNIGVPVLTETSSN